MKRYKFFIKFYDLFLLKLSLVFISFSAITYLILNTFLIILIFKLIYQHNIYIELKYLNGTVTQNYLWVVFPFLVVNYLFLVLKTGLKHNFILNNYFFKIVLWLYPIPLKDRLHFLYLFDLLVVESKKTYNTNIIWGIYIYFFLLLNGILLILFLPIVINGYNSIDLIAFFAFKSFAFVGLSVWLLSVISIIEDLAAPFQV